MALVLASVLVAALVQAMGDAAHLTRSASIHHEAEVLARRLVEEQDAQTETGIQGALTWQRKVGPSPHDPRTRTLEGFRLVRISVAVEGPGLDRPIRYWSERIVK